MIFSSLVPGDLLPKRPLMKSGGRQQQQASDKIKEKPGQQNSTGAGKQSPDYSKTNGGFPVLVPRFLQASRANHPVFMFGHTFPAKKQSAFRAAGHGLAIAVMMAALRNQGWRLRRHAAGGSVCTLREFAREETVRINPEIPIINAEPIRIENMAVNQELPET